MSVNPSTLSWFAPEFTPQGATSPQFKQQQYYQDQGSYKLRSGQDHMQHAGMNAYYMGGYSYGYYGAGMQSPTHHMNATTSFASTQSGAINLDDFSDLSDSDDEEMKISKLEAEMDKGKQVEAPTISITEEDHEPAEEPSPCATDVQSLDEFEAASEIPDSSSASSEPEEEEVDLPVQQDSETSPDTVFELRQMLKWREWILKNEQPTILYRTEPVPQSTATPSWRVAQEQTAVANAKRTQPKSKLEASDNSWSAQQRRRREAEQKSDSSACVARNVKSILNKLTLEKFSSLTQQLLNCGMSSSGHVEVLIHEVFEKATTQHHYIDMYTDLCVLLHEHFTVKPFAGAGELKAGRKLTFKRLLLDECQSSFERLLAPPEGLEDLPPAERTAAEVGYKTHMLGNIKLVGGLLSRGMLASKVGIAILEELLSNPTAEALESAAALLTALGPTADHKDWPQYTALNAIFDQISTIVKAKKCQPRERFLLKDLLELRAAGWVSFRPRRLERAMTLAQVADTAAGRQVAPQAIRMVSAATPTAFDQDKFREGMQKALVELRYSGCISEALERLEALGVPPTQKQAAELAEIVSHAVQEGSIAERERAMKVMVDLAGSNGWCPDALSGGMSLFVKEIAPDLAFDVPGLQKILSEELSTFLSSEKHRGAFAAVMSFQASDA